MALALLVTLAAGVAASLVVGFRTNEYTRQRDIAQAAAHTQIEAVRSWGNYETLVDTFDGTTFEVDDLPVADGSPAGSVQIDATNPDLVSVRVIVSWSERSGRTERYELNTRLANTNP